MAAYAALASLKHIIHNLQNHPSPPISIDEQQVESLTEAVTFLQDFLRGFTSNFAYTEEADPLEIRIANAAYVAEAVIESNIVDQIQIRSTIIGKVIGVLKFSLSLCKCTCLVDDLHRDLQLVIEEMDLIKKMAMTIHTDNNDVRSQLRRRVSTAVGPFMSSSTPSMVGVDDVFLQVLESLTGSQPGLQVIPITGMGGIGKTTLARKLFEDALVKEKFDILAWTTISQDYNAQQVLQELLSQAKEISSGKSEGELGLELYQHLSGRRYLIVMDDMWSIEVWDKIRRYFPNFGDGSRVLVTSRLSNLASHFNNGFNMKFLDKVSCWNLFSKIVFGVKSFPLELEEIGKKIVRNCRGLPLSIVTVGGLLRKSDQTLEHWEHIEGNLNSIVNSEDHDYCLRILKMSYNNLHVHLKPCFLYMGVFEEDCKIRVSTLIQLWISEGFLEQSNKKTLETVGEENLKNLIERNLILVHELGSTGNIKYCKIHDLLRDLCLREAEKERFYPFVPGHSREGIYRKRPIIIHRSAWNKKALEVLQSMPHARSFLCVHDFVNDEQEVRRRSPALWLMRKSEASSGSRYSLKDVFRLFNVRYIALEFQAGYRMHIPMSVQFPSSLLNLLWNLQTLNVSYSQTIIAPVEIWDMPHLRHVKFRNHVFLPDPPTGNVVIMENLQTFKTLKYPILRDEVARRIPNIKKLDIAFGKVEGLTMGYDYYYYCQNKLEHLHKLESFRCSLEDLCIDEDYYLVKKLNFPQSLKKLVLNFNRYCELDEMLEKTCSLPLLQKLRLGGGFFRTGKWATVEGQFPKLEFLSLRNCDNLKQWTSESSHFPLVKEIHLEELALLKEIPSEIGDIPTLRAIVLKRCNESTVMSARRIIEEQEELQGEVELPFHVRVYVRNDKRKAMQRLASPNFEVMKN